MKVRISVWLMLAVVFTIVFPWMRQLEYGQYLPDVWLLLLLIAVPTPFPYSARKPIILALCLALLRSAVSVPSLIASCAALLAALFVRGQLYRHLSDSLAIYRFIIGIFSALPMMLIDMSIATRHQLPFSVEVIAWRLVLVGLVLTISHRRSRATLFGGGR